MTEEQRPALRIVRGEPSAEELAALTALLATAGDDAPAPEPPAHGRWADPSWQHRRPVRPGAGGWIASSR